MPFVNCQTVVHGGPNQMDESLEDSSEDEEDPFKTMLLESMQESQFEKTPKPYLPQDTIDKIFCPRSKRKNDIDWKIFEPMGINVAALTDDELSLAYHIVATCPKLYLIAVFIELEPEPLRTLMSIFRQDGFTDKDIPIDVWPMDKLKAGIKQHPFYVLEKKYPVRKRRIWNLSRINKFQSEQWRFLAPIISTSEPLHDFGQCTIPFVAKHDIIGKGGNGIVYKYEIHNAHFKDPISLFSATEARVNGSDRVRIKNVVAVKEIRNQGSEVAKRWEREVRALARMNKLRQEHIVRFITAFRRKGTSDDIEHYVVFEWADGGNLSDLRAAYPNPGLTAARIKWVVRQLYGLAQALSKAHYLEGEGSYRHGDLKPANILWFKQGDTEFGTLKIGDWGEAKEHDNVTALRHDTTAQSGTRRYEPPEVVTGVPSSLSQESRFVRSRLYDIWGIGCITLEIIIWLVYGLSELKRFDKENIGTYGISEFFYEVSLNKPAKVHGVAEYWMEQIAKDPRCSRHTSALGDLLEIVRTNLLIVKLPVDGGAKGPHLSPNYLVEKQASNTGGLQPATSISENLFNENGNKISIQITSEWRDATLAGPEEPRRCRATEFEDRLEKILAFEQDESYWSKGCAPRPAPAASRRSDLLSVESAPIALARGALSPMSEQKDYGKANYDPEAWFFVLDNDFAKQILDRLKDARLSPPTTISASNVLCDKCAAVRGVIWSSFFKITYETARLAHNASEQICELCSLLWRTYEKFSSSRSHEVMFQRSGSMLLMDALKSPVLTLSRNNGKQHFSYSILIRRT
jgi:serine/threonine protein kinase